MQAGTEYYNIIFDFHDYCIPKHYVGVSSDNSLILTTEESEKINFPTHKMAEAIASVVYDTYEEVDHYNYQYTIVKTIIKTSVNTECFTYKNNKIFKKGKR